MMKPINTARFVFLSRSVNESFARGALAAFLAQADPTVPQLADIKTAVSEAVTNCIVHAYPGGLGVITLTVALYENGLVKLRWRTKAWASRTWTAPWSHSSPPAIRKSGRALASR